MSSEPEKAVVDQPVSTGNFQADLSLLNTSLQTLGILNSKLNHQFFENIDDLLINLRQNCSDENYQQIAGCFEVLLRQPLRRALGRIRCVSRSLEEIKRHFVASEPFNGQDTPKAR